MAKPLNERRNFGWGSRDAIKAAKFALRDAERRGVLSIKSSVDHLQRFSQFHAWLREAYGVKRLDHIQHGHVQAYGRMLAQKVRSGEIKPATAQNLISSINTTLRIASRGQWQPVSPTEDCGIAPRSSVRAAPTPTPIEARAAIGAIRDPIGRAIAQLQHSLGLRIKEASLLNARAALRQAQKTGKITIGQAKRGHVGSGTKGGRVRSIPVSKEAMQALREAAKVQPRGSRSMIPANQSLKSFANTTLREVRETLRQYGFRPHDLRASYAAARYEQLTGKAAPCNGGGRASGPGQGLSDRQAREIIAAELGHGRASVVSAYIGGSR
ncbi:MAG: site-specific integrase [Zetaproteobacteria bacterium]|nr:MAG: site-specific integrase [Zetaproteobacteria bacterium]